MGAIYDFFQMIWNVLSSVIDWFIQLLEDLFYMIKLLVQFLVNIPSYFSWLPSGVITIIVTIFGIVVIYKILGREG